MRFLGDRNLPPPNSVRGKVRDRHENKEGGVVDRFRLESPENGGKDKDHEQDGGHESVGRDPSLLVFCLAMGAVEYIEEPPPAVPPELTEDTFQHVEIGNFLTAVKAMCQTVGSRAD